MGLELYVPDPEQTLKLGPEKNKDRSAAARLPRTVPVHVPCVVCEEFDLLTK
jgi:hypothetical protein